MTTEEAIEAIKDTMTMFNKGLITKDELNGYLFIIAYKIFTAPEDS